MAFVIARFDMAGKIDGYVNEDMSDYVLDIKEAHKYEDESVAVMCVDDSNRELVIEIFE